MAQRKLYLFLTLILIGGMFQGCVKDECTAERTYTDWIPVWLTEEEMRGPISVDEPRELENPGKIYYYNDYILINEPREGIHLIDNTVPENPMNVGFLTIVGNVDMAVKGGILYADSYYDLVTIDFTEPLNATLIKRLENVYDPISVNAQNGQILAYYKEEEVTVVGPCNGTGPWGQPFFDFAGGGPEVLANNNSTGGAVPPSGVGGSMARFTLSGDHLYTVDERTLRTFSLSNPECPEQSSEISVGWDIETIYPYKENLFIGSRSGMFIYGLNNPGTPEFLSQFQHARACDPVFVKDDYAYVTLRSGTMCDGFNNQLDLIDISTLTAPVLERTFPMQNPHGLSINANSLFLCEGEHGLKVFDIEDPFTLGENLVDQISGLHTYDVISLPNGLLLVIGKDGFYQYNYEDPSNLVEVSFIPVAG